MKTTGMGSKTENRVLLVNDHPDQLEMTSLLLGQSGYSVITACDGREGFETARRESPDVVISGVSMPRMGGIEMCRLIREDPDLRATPVLLVSAGHKDSESVIEGLKAGADDYLEAPYDPMRLLTKVTQLIERKRAEEALRKSQARLAGIVNAAMDAIITVDSEQRILLFNTAAERMFRCSAGEAIGQALDRFIPERFRPMHSAHIRSFGQTGITTRAMAGARAIYGLRADGEEFPLEASISQVESSEQKLYTVTMRDITERKQAEESLLRLAAIVESSSDAIIGNTLDGAIVTWNPGAERLFGYTADEAIGRHLTIVVPADRADEVPRLLEKIGRGDGAAHYETVRVNRDGTRIDVSITVSPIQDSAGKIVGASTIARDIGEQKRAEEKLRESEEHYRNVAETATDAIITTDEESAITSVNRAAERIFGHRSEDLLGQKLTALMPGYLRHVHQASLKTYITTGDRQLEYWECIDLIGLKKGGLEIPVELSVSRFTKNAKHVFTCIVRDITERKQAQESLLRLAAIVESSSEAIIGNTLDGTIITWNPGAARLFGYSADEAIGRHLTIVVPAGRADEVPRLLEKIGRGDSVAHYETVRLNKDGMRIDVSITVSPIQDSAGRIIGASTIARDIGEQKRAEEKLRESEEHYRNVAETATDAIITTDEESAITSVNRAAERIFGHRSEDLLGQKLTALMPEYLRHVHQASLKTYITTGDRQLEYWECIELTGLKEGGWEIPVELSVSRFTKNDKHVFTCIVRDITERKQAQESLLRLAAIVESSSDAIIGKTLDGTIFAWNPGAGKLFGYSAGEAIGRHISILIPADRKDEVPQILERIGRSESTENYETVRLNREGKGIDVSVTVSPIKDGDGAVIGASTIARDITEQKQAEAKLKALTADLLHSNRELQDFASVASHDLQEPLRKIQTFADDLAENSASTLSDENRGTLKRIQNAAGRMQRLINDLLLLSRISSGAQPFVQVDLNNVAREVLSDLEVRINETGGRVDLGEIPTIEAEPLQMRQLFQNLVGNALKFNSTGRTPIVSVHGELIGGKEGLAGSSSEAQAQQLCQITFEDNGIGFDEKYVDRIFAMFQRLHGRNEYEGTGMGLAICRRIAEHHGGNITAQSILGTGSTFTVTLPTTRIKEKAV
ncbi:MAG: PAS domain S-box protein [Acidobacteriota bacterium]